MEKVDWLLVVTIVLILADGLMALPFWHLEGNPIVLAMGPYVMVTTKTIASLAFAGVFYSLGEYRKTTIPVFILSGLFGLYLMVLATNLWVLL